MSNVLSALVQSRWVLFNIAGFLAMSVAQRLIEEMARMAGALLEPVTIAEGSSLNAYKQ